MLQHNVNNNQDQIKEQKEVISEFQDTVTGLTDQMDDYKENLIEAATVINKLRWYIGAAIAVGQREMGNQYDGFHVWLVLLEISAAQ